jgi:hypothetical protein
VCGRPTPDPPAAHAFRKPPTLPLVSQPTPKNHLLEAAVLMLGLALAIILMSSGNATPVLSF